MTKRTAMFLSLAGLVFGAQAAFAELPPQYTVWGDFAAITAQGEVPEQLGVVDRIERAEDGSYVAHGRNCSLTMRVVREPARSSDGQPMPGPSRVARVVMGAKQCK